MRHAPDERADFGRDRAKTDPASAVRFAGPRQPKALAMPTHQCIGLEDVQRLRTAGPQAVEPDPEQALAPRETQPLGIFPHGHGQLLAQRDDLHVERNAASEDTAQRSE